MSCTVADVLSAAGLQPAGAVPWGTPVPETAPGVYVVALTDDPTRTVGGFPRAPLDLDALERLLALRPELSVDGACPTAAQMADRLGGYWLSGEDVLYIGLAGQPLRTRVRQYYRTPLGARKPHAGGWWLKTLSILDELWVHYAPTSNFAAAEKRALKAFAGSVGPAEREALHDPINVAPFANLRCFNDIIKNHGVRGATGDLSTAASSTPGKP